MRRVQLHLALTADRHEQRDPLFIVIVNAKDDLDAQEWFAEEYPDTEYDVVEICCDGCSHPLDDCGCKEETPCIS